MPLFTTGRTKLSKSTTVNQTTTNITDRRVGASDDAVVATEGSHIERIEADIIEDSLGKLLGFASDQSEQTLDILSAGLDLVEGANRQGGELVSEVLAKSRSEASEGLKDVNKTLMYVGLAFAAAFALRGMR